MVNFHLQKISPPVDTKLNRKSSQSVRLHIMQRLGILLTSVIRYLPSGDRYLVLSTIFPKEFIWTTADLQPAPYRIKGMKMSSIYIPENLQNISTNVIRFMVVQKKPTPSIKQGYT